MNTDWRGNNPFGVGEFKWTAKASIENGRWVAALALPLAELAERPRAGTVWGVNFTRERRAEGEEFSTWASIEGKTFHAPQQFGHLVFAAEPVTAVREVKELQKPRTKSQKPVVIPQVQTFGHFDYVLRHEEYKHLAENPDAVNRREAPRPAYCPSNPDTYKLVFDLFEEV